MENLKKYRNYNVYAIKSTREKGIKMLKEKIFYKDSLPINITTAHIKEYPIHFHDDIEIAYVLSGSLTLKNGYYSFDLKTGDVFIINDREIHSFTCDGNQNTVMLIQLNMHFFSKYYNNFKNCFFVTDLDDKDQAMEILREYLCKIMVLAIEKGRHYEDQIIEYVHNVIDLLMSDFQYFAMENGKFINEAKNKGNKILAGRMNRITDYMYENYYRRLTLNEIAEREHLSIFYLSHVIKTASGLSFQELLSFIRVEESEKLLLGTSKKIGIISEECGFSAVRYYIKYFIKWFGLHPEEYRRIYTGKVFSRETSADITLAKPQTIKNLIKKNNVELSGELADNEFISHQVIYLSYEDFLGKTKMYQPNLFEVLHNDSFKPATLLFEIFRDLQEPLIILGENYILSGSLDKSIGQPNCLNFLIYNVNEEMQEIFENKTLKTVFGSVKRMNHVVKLLIKVGGIKGNLKITKISLTKKNIINSYMLELFKNNEIRQSLVTKWSTNPEVTVTRMTVTDTLSLHLNLEGLSGQLILIDRLL